MEEPDESMEWPKCRMSIEGIGAKLICDLPRYHERDGDQRHHDPSGARWWFEGTPVLEADPSVIEGRATLMRSVE